MNPHKTLLSATALLAILPFLASATPDGNLEVAALASTIGVQSTPVVSKTDAKQAFLSEMSVHATAAYEDEATAKSLLSTHNINRYIPFKGKTGYGQIQAESDMGYVSYSPAKDAQKARIVISVRGTVTSCDTATDGNIELTALSPVFMGSEPATGDAPLVHTGFQTATIGVMSNVMTALKSLTEELGQEQFAQSEVYVTGHSLGGAISSLMALGLTHQTKLLPQGISGLVTFGEPAIGNRQTVSLLDQSVTNATHVFQSLDPVAQLCRKGYAKSKHRLQVLNSGYNTHGMAGYQESLTTDAPGSFVDHPEISQAVVSIANHVINATADYMYNYLNSTSLTNSTSQETTSAAGSWLPYKQHLGGLAGKVWSFLSSTR